MPHPCCSPASPLFVSTILRFLLPSDFPPPLYTGYNATQPYITRRPSLSFSLRVCSLPLDRRSCVACVCVDTARGGENENSSRVRMLASGIQLERAIGPNGMKFLCGQTQERSRASFFSLAQPELPPIRTIFVQPESRVIEMASLFLRAYPERNEISLGECSFCSISHVERIDGISFFSGAGSSSFDLISNREGSEPPPPPPLSPDLRPKFFRYNSFLFVSSSLFLSLCSQFRRIYLALAHRKAKYPFWRVKTLPSRVKLPGGRHLVCSGDARKVVPYL